MATTADTVITSSMLTAAGVSVAMAAALVGKTVAEAADWLSVVFTIKTATGMIDAGTVKKYVLEGQSVERFTAAEISAALRFIMRMKSSVGFTVVPISLASC